MAKAKPRPAPAAAKKPATLRRAPSQQRARERVERILAVASELIAATGSDTLRMSEVAEQAGISIGSLYQYFPDKAAILRTLAERYNAEGRACIEAGLAPVTDLKSLCQAFAALVDIYYGYFLAEPVMRDIWSGTQADKALREIELDHSRVIGGLLAATLSRIWPKLDRKDLEAGAFLLMHLGEATMRLAVSVKRREGDALVAAYQAMAAREFVAIAARAPRRARRS